MIKQTTQPRNQKRIALTLIACGGVLFSLYVYFICASIMHVVAREEVDRSLSERRSTISSLEADFIAAQHAVSENVAYLNGYEEVHTKVFIDRAEPSLVLNTQ